MDELLNDAAHRAGRYLRELPERPVFPSRDAIGRLKLLDVPLQDEPLAPERVLAELDEIGSPATVATSGGRYYGFVTGGSLPASLAANWMAGAWDQNAALRVISPVAAALEDVSRKWLLDLLGLPTDAGVGFVTGATMANFTGLAAARHHVLAKCGWDVGANGLFGAPPINVIVGDEVHVSLLKALGMLGLGRERVTRVPVDRQGRMRADALPPMSEPAIVCLQSGNVNTGAFDPAEEIIAAAHAAGAWVHVDGAFGLWALASPELAHLARGVPQADSWATDAHKWLNVPYDSGLAVVRDARALQAAMAASAAYLLEGEERESARFIPDMSHRARGVEIWAAMRSLGRSGLADLFERCCRYARRFADGLASAGYEVLNDVVLNQVLVAFGSEEETQAVMKGIQNDATCWCGGTRWQGRVAMRISVSSWATTDEDVERSLEAMLRVAKETLG